MKNEDHFTHLSIPSQSLLPVIDILEKFAELINELYLFVKIKCIFYSNS